MTTQEATLNQVEVSESDVEEYLRANPDFFASRPELVEMMQLPHTTGAAVSLIEYQVRVMREKNAALEHKLFDLVEVARENEHLSTRLHHLALGLIEAEHLEGVLSIAQDLLRDELKADFVHIRLIAQDGSEGLHDLPADESTMALFDALFEEHRPLCGHLDEAQKSILFPEEADEVASSVIVPLTDPEHIGILAVGSRDNERFYPGMGTLFMGTLGELVSRAIRMHREDRG